MLFYYYILILAYNLGLYKVPAGFTMLIMDFFNIMLFIISIFIYVRERKKINFKYFKFLEKVFLVFLIYFAIIAFNSETFFKYGKISNIRALYPLFLFFSTISIINNLELLKKFKKHIIIMAIIGSIMSIIQSLYGIDPIFDTNLFYNIGHWEGQQHIIIGNVARVMLPTIYLIYVTTIMLIIYISIYHKYRYYSFLFLFIITILIGYARSQWVAILITIIVCLLLIKQSNKVSLWKLSKNIFLVLLVFSLTLYIFSKTFGHDIINEFYERAIATYEDTYLQTGTFGSRIQTLALSLGIWSTSPLFGKGIYYWQFENLPQLSDIGFTYTMVTIGLIGLILFLFYMFSNILFGYKIIKHSIVINNKELLFAGFAPLVVSLLFLITQHFTQYGYTLTIVSISSAYPIIMYKLIK